MRGFLAGRVPHRKNFARALRGKGIFVTSGMGFITLATYSQTSATGQISVEIWPHCANCVRLHACRAMVERIQPGAKWLSNSGTLGNSCVERKPHPARMLKVKDTLRATVHLSFDGRVFKTYHGPDAEKRFANEVLVLRHLETRGCNFVPRLLEADQKKLRIITTNCGSRVERLDEQRTKELFAELEKFDVRHDDPDIRNVTYRSTDGRFCLIDFEFATILPENKSSSSSSSSS